MKKRKELKQLSYVLKESANVWRSLALILCLVTLMPTAYSQKNNDAFTVTFEKKGLTEVFKDLERRSNYTFTYNSKDLNEYNGTVSAIFRGSSLKQILDYALKGSPFTYKVNNNTEVVILKKQEKRQTYKLEGRVYNEKKESLPGVTILVKNGNIGCATNMDGAFSTGVYQPTGQLVASSIGFKKSIVTYDVKKPLIIILKEDVSSLDEVTVVGYGERTNKELISSVSTVKGEDIKEIPSASIENLIQGKMAGVEITNSSGAPGGGGAIIAIRGYNSMIDQNQLRMNDYGEPLYVIDGIPVQGFTSPITGTNTLSSIDPSTIESIEVLKDASSAAIYGSRAGRGVILITTKKGKEGKARFSVNASHSWSILPSSPEQTGGIDARRYALLALRNMRRPYTDPTNNTSAFPKDRNEAFNVYPLGGVYDYFWNKASVGFVYNPNNNESPILPFVQDSLNSYYNNSTDWYRYAFRVGKVLNANIQASGGGEKYNYLVGTGVYKEAGIAYGSDFTRVNFLTNLRITPVEKLMVDTRFSISYLGRHRGNASGGWGSAQKIERIPVDPLQTSSFLPGGGAIEEKLLEAINQQIEKNESYDIKASVLLNYQFNDNLSLRVSGSGNMGIQALDTYKPSILSSNKLSTAEGQVGRTLMVLNENLLTYKKTFNEDHNVEVLAGLSLEKNRRNIILAQGVGGANDKVHYIYDGFPEVPSADIATNMKILQHARTDLLESSLISTFARASYNYKQKYLTEFTIRRDGSSVFGDKNKYANFPAGAIGWAFSEERFMDWAWWLSHGKIRASLGRSGETYPDPYKAHGLLTPGGEFLGRPLLNVDRSDWGGMINRELKWVIHDQYDIGIDLNLFDNKIRFKADYYNRKSYGVLAPTKLPKTIYLYDNKVRNANNAVNRGVEFEIQADIIRKEDFSWRLNFNASHNENFLRGTFDSRDVGLPNGIPYHMIGRPLYMIYTFVDGKIYGNSEEVPTVYDTNGEAHSLYLANKKYPFTAGMKRIEDLNGDYQVNYLDQRYRGSSLPKLTGGLASEFRYKNFDLSLQFTYALGRKMINQKKWESLNPEDVILGKPILADLSELQFWEKPGDENIPGILPMVSLWDKTMLQYHAIISSNVENVNYLKLKTLTFGYNLPEKWVRKMNLSKVRFFFTGENLLTFTNYTGPDPEVVPLIGVYPGSDNYKNYPLSRRLTLGLSVDF